MGIIKEDKLKYSLMFSTSHITLRGLSYMNFTWILGLMILSQQFNNPGSLSITNNGQPISTVNRSDLSLNLPGLPIMNTVKFNKFMDEIDKNVSKDPKNAFIDRSGNIIGEQIGYRLDRQKFTEQIYTYYFNNTTSELEAPLQAIYPPVDSELLGTIRSEKIGEYVTAFSTNKKTETIIFILPQKRLIILLFIPVKPSHLIKWLGKEQQVKVIYPLLSS